jgi:hypothetical protein
MLKVFFHEKNLDYPPKANGHFVRKVDLRYYSRRTSIAIKREFIDHEEDGLMSLQLDLNREIIDTLASLELYNIYDYDCWKHGRWLNQQIISYASNIIHSLEYVFKKEEDGEWN